MHATVSPSTFAGLVRSQLTLEVVNPLPVQDPPSGLRPVLAAQKVRYDLEVRRGLPVSGSAFTTAPNAVDEAEAAWNNAHPFSARQLAGLLMISCPRTVPRTLA